MFGQQTQAQGTTLGFGFGTTPAPATTSTTGGGFSFMSQPTTATATSQPTTTPFGAAGLGGTTWAAPTMSTTTASAAPFAFGAPQATTTTTATVPPLGATFGATTSAAPFAFGTPQAATTTTATVPPLGTTFGTTTSAAAPFAFGTPQATTTTATTGTVPPLGTTFGTTTSAAPFAFGTPQATTTTSGTVPPLGTTFGTATTAAPTQLKLPTFGAPTATTTAAPTAAQQPGTSFTGLGGLQPAAAGVSADTSQALATGGGTVGGVIRTEERTLRDAALPIELIELVEELKIHMKNETDGLNEVASTIGVSIEKVAEKCESIRVQLNSISNVIHRQLLNCEALLADAEKDRRDAEMARKLHGQPYSHEQKEPTNYLYNTLYRFHEKIAIYKREILKAEVALKSMDTVRPFTPVDLAQALQSTKDSLILLAARVKNVHEHIVSESESHRNLIRFVKGGNLTKGIFFDKSKSAMPRLPRHTGPPPTQHDRTIDYLHNANVLFPSKFNKSPHKTAFNDTTARPNSAQRHLHSTQLPHRQLNSTAAFNTSGFGPSLFQTPISPIFHPGMTSPLAGSSLKRTKH